MLIAPLLLSLQGQSFSPADFEKHVRFLASEEMKGRDTGSAEDRKAAQYVADAFKEQGLKPGGKDGWFQEFMVQGKEARNVIGLLPGGDMSEYVIVAAHHDARGIVHEKAQPGADDNASGVAMLLELARSLRSAKPKRTILFISFDAEEKGMVGSREFVKSELYDPKSIAAVFVFDLVGGNFMEWEKNRIYALGSEYSAELFDRVLKGAGSAGDLEVVRSSVALIEPFPDMARSDYHAFRGKGVPFIFFSTGTPWYYHTEHDTVERLNFQKMAKAAGFLRRMIVETSDDDRRPVFRSPIAVPEDAKNMAAALSKVLENRARLRITEKQVESTQALLSEIEGAKEPNLKKLQQATILLFSIARSQGK